MTAPLMPAIQAIGVIRSRFRAVEGIPIQPVADPEGLGEAHLDPALIEGLADLVGFERIWLLTWLHRAPPARLTVSPFLDARSHGVFATRSPCRPNPIGLACVRLLGIDGAVLRFAGCDLLDGTPLLDLKPYVPEFDAFPGVACGWFAGRSAAGVRADDRFTATSPTAAG